MTEIISKEYIKTIINNIAVSNNILNWCYLVEKFDCVAQNYFGVLVPVVLHGKNDGENISLKLVLKLAPTDDRYRVSGAITTMFKREIFVYSKVFHAYKDMQKHWQPDSQYTIPQCYYFCPDYCKEVIAMQNMCKIGFKPIVQNMFLDIDHITISIKSLAKFHALSFLLEYKENDTYEEVKKICLPLSENTNKRFMDILHDRLDKAIQKFENTSYVPLLKNLKQNCVTLIESVYLSSERNCLCHGDIWKENILFKYENDVPTSACLIDYQTIRMSSPAYDVLYLIISSTNSELRREYFMALLQIYYKTLVQIFCEAHLDDVKTYSLCQFHNDLKLVGPACFIVANTALWLSNGLQEEGHVRSKHIWNTESEKIRAVEQYKATIKGIIDDFLSYGYLPAISNESQIN